MQVPALYLSLFFLCVSADRQFSCPNNGEPKLADDATPVQCLPGQNVCGRGFSCFFSGFNYACCPTAQEDYDEFNGTECPEGSVVVIDAVGSALRCNHRTGRCPDHKMFCARHGSDAICCESLNPPRQQQTRSTKTIETTTRTAETKTTRQPRSTTTRKPLTTTTKKPINIMELECPRNHLTVLTDNGEPFICDEKIKCPSANMKCSAVESFKICCESVEPARNYLDDEDGKVVTFEPENQSTSDELNPLKYKPDDVLRVQEELFLQKELESAIVPENFLENAKPKKNNKQSKNRSYIDNENTKYISLPESSLTQIPTSQQVDLATTEASVSTTTQTATTSQKVEFSKRRPHIQEGHIRAFGVNTRTNVNEPVKIEQTKSTEKTSSVEYRPHQQGGYAVSRKIEKINSKAVPTNSERKARVQQFLMNQVRQGWPYDEKFYHPDRISTDYRPPRTEAVIHFDN